MPHRDRLLVILGTLLVVAVVGYAAATAAEPPTRGRGPVFVPADSLDGEADQGPVPGGMGARVDPQTLEIVGLDLQGEDGSRVLAWETLRQYEYQEGLAGLPEDLRALDGQKVTMAGFLLPLYEFEDIKDFNLVASHWSCCFGVPPGINGWVHVTLAPGQRGLENTTEPIRVTGTFRIEEQKEAGYVISIYAIEDAKAAVIGW